MSKFEINYTNFSMYKAKVEANNIYEAIDKFKEKNVCCAINSVKYIYEGKEEPQEWYCIWWNGNSWNSKVVMAHNREEVIYNIKEKLDYAVYDFKCCLNKPESIEGIHRSIWD